MLARGLAVLLVIALGVCTAVCKAESQVSGLDLKPDMPALTHSLVPPLEVRVSDADIADSGLSIEPTRQYHWVFSPGKPFVLKVGSTEKTQAESVVMTVYDWDNRPVAQRQFTSPSSENVKFRVHGRGTYIVTLDAVKGGESTSRLVRSFSVCPANEGRRKAWANSGFWVGQCSFPGWQGVVWPNGTGRKATPDGITEDQSRNLDAELVSRMGVQIARVNFPVIRRDQEGYDLDFTLADKCIKAFASKGLRLDLQFFAPEGKGPGPIKEKYREACTKSTAAFPIEEKPLRYFVREAAKRYVKYAAFFQIGNEPGNPDQYGGTAEEFSDSVLQAKDELKRAYPKVPFTNGGYCFINGATKEIIRDLRGETDFASYHCHYEFPVLPGFFEDIRGMHRDAGYSNIEYANTEMGYAIWAAGTEKTNAVNVMQKLLYCWAHGNKGVMLYSSRELQWPRQYAAGADFGFVDYFFCPRFVYGAASAFLDRYAGYRFEKILLESENLYVYQFRKGESVLVSYFAAKSPATVGFASDAKGVVLIDSMGNEKPSASGEVISVSAGGYPQAIVFSGATRVELNH